jgi:hypothetical protein
MPKEDKGKVKMTVIHFETESDNDTLKENIRSISITLSKALSIPQKAPLQPHMLTNGDKKTTNDILEESQEELEFESPNSKTILKRTIPRIQRVPKVVDIDLKGGQMPLKEFLDTKKPDGDNRKYLAITFWLNKFGGIEDVTGDHVYTCYRYMGWQVPEDITSPFRNMKGKQYGWIVSGKTKGSFKINHIGENQIEKM